MTKLEYRVVFTCKACGQTFLKEAVYRHHEQKHQHTHIDTWSLQPQDNQKLDFNDMPVGLNRELFKVFEKYGIGIGNKVIMCLWRNDQLNSAIRSVGREHELIERLKEWLEQR